MTLPMAWSRVWRGQWPSILATGQSRCAIMAYDYTVLRGAGGNHHKKKDRLLTLAEKWSLPVVLLQKAEGPAGRRVADSGGLDTTTFTRFGALTARCPPSAWCRAAALLAMQHCSVAAM